MSPCPCPRSVMAALLALTVGCSDMPPPQAKAATVPGKGGETFVALLDLEKSVQKLSAERNNCWNTGTWDRGVAWTFDMGKRRVNWNHARQAICTFRPPRDLSAYKGLRIGVATDRPRLDAEVSVWLGENDGSWYYLKSAVPLAARKNEAVVLFEDFNVAEWIVPGSHQDEDFRIDLKSVGRIAVGVVNPFGVGEVSFKLTRLDLVRASSSDARPAATVRVTGKTVSINDHDVVPAGLFGGYARYLPQEYRPGCQRNLCPPTYPIVPRQQFVRFGERSFADWPGMVRALRGESQPHEKLGKHLLALIEDAGQRRALEKLDVDRRLADLRKRNRDPNAAPQELTRPLNGLLRHPGLYDRDAWAGVRLDDDLRAHLAKGTRNDTERMELNRWLLEAAFGKLIRPVSRRGPTEMFYIDCFGERRNTPHLLYRSDWKEMLTEHGRQVAINARKAGYQAHWEFWNEPYLHWNRDRVSLHSRYFRTDLATEGGPVMVKRTSGAHDAHVRDGEIIPHFKWVRGTDPKGLKDAVNGLYVVDETAFTFWAGAGNGWIYDQMLAAAASSIKKHNPDVQVVAGWGFRWNEDHWDAWRIVYKNTIDRNIRWIDGVHEHHYQGDTTAMNGSYEVLAAYGVTRHNKWLYSYNTETNDLVDTPARGAIDTPAKAAASYQYRQMVYNLRDLVYSVIQSPDKVRARTMIHPHRAPDATRVCFGLLKDLRGRLVEARSDDDNVWAVASIDGTDPRAMPPDFDGVPKLVVVIFNDYRRPRKVAVTVEAPTGTTFGDATIERTGVDRTSFALDLARRERVKVGRTKATFALELDDRSAWKIALPLKGKLAGTAEVRRKQFFSAGILQKVRPGTPWKTTVSLDPKTLRAAARAWLRLVIEDVAVGEGTVTVAGKAMALPKACTADNVNRIVELPLEPGTLKPETEVTFAVRPGNFAGYQVDMTSIVLETRRD